MVLPLFFFSAADFCPLRLLPLGFRTPRSAPRRRSRYFLRRSTTTESVICCTLSCTSVKHSFAAGRFQRAPGTELLASLNHLRYLSRSASVPLQQLVACGGRHLAESGVLAPLKTARPASCQREQRLQRCSHLAAHPAAAAVFRARRRPGRPAAPRCRERVPPSCWI